MKKFDANDIDDVLKGVPGLTSSKRAYVKGMLMGKNSHGGVNEFELGRAMREMKRNRSDEISSFHVDRIHGAINDLMSPVAESEQDEAA